MNKHRKHSDYLLSLAVFALIAFGLIMIYSVSKYYSLEVTDGATDKYYLKHQFYMICIGLVAWIATQSIDYHFWQKNASWMFFATIGLILLPVVLTPLGLAHEYRWISLGFNFQPAELAKLTFIFYLAGLFSKQGENLKNIAKSFYPFLIAIGIIAVLMALQKDLGTLAVIILISAGMFLVSGAPFIQLIASLGIGTFGVWLLIKIEPYRMQRILTFLNPDASSTGAGYHIKNALIAIGSGGLWGLGFGQSKQKYLYLPEAHTDSIFAIICEELGALRSALVIVVFCFIAYRGLRIARNAPDIFGRLVAIGVTVWIFSQMAINIAAMFAIVPLTGIPLPFISYGGTSIIILLAAVGVLTNISKYQMTNQNKKW
ncbi:MAG: putative peptidoglycan glycosyltransferase FtsW [Candidatus Berkelbacteria bacterium]|nr:putative peptidoglycan glycosyltransferase FtsW [Candidatus Berkelbacteria bacterium]